MSYRINEDQREIDNDDRRKFPHRVASRGAAVLPAMFTLGNLLCGCAAILLASWPRDLTNLPFHWTPLTFAALFIFGGMAFDGLDGRIARLTRNTSELGEQLDSMADMVTFGVAPAFAAVQLVSGAAPFASIINDQYFHRATLIVGGIYAACTALRLARFNIEVEEPEEADHTTFKGLPSPGAAGTVAALILLHQHFLAHYQSDLVRVAAVGMIAVTLLVALAMVSKLRYVHLLNVYVRGRAPFETIVAGVVMVMVLLIHPQGALAGGAVLYALSAPVAAIYRRFYRAPPSDVRTIPLQDDKVGPEENPEKRDQRESSTRRDVG